MKGVRIDVANTFIEPDDWVVAIVSGVVSNGNHGPYVKAGCFKSRDCWLGRDTILTFSREFLPKTPEPEGGMIVVLWNCSIKTKGWRAYSAALYGKEHTKYESIKLSSSEEEALRTRKSTV